MIVILAAALALAAAGAAAGVAEVCGIDLVCGHCGAITPGSGHECSEDPRRKDKTMGHKHEPAAAALTAATGLSWLNFDEYLLYTLAVWHERHPQVDIHHGVGYWQAQLRGPNDERHVITRLELSALLQVLEELE